MQRLRVTFSRGEEVKYISHLDLMRLWHRTLRRAGLPMVYSEGFNPRPRLSLAAPLAVGVTSEGELMDLFLKRRVSPFSFIREVTLHLPQGVDVREAQEVGLGLPSLQSLVRHAEYRVEVEKGLAGVEESIRSLLSTKHLPWQHQRDKEVRKYDLRALIDALWVVDWGEGRGILGMRLRADNLGSGRPEQVVAALGFPNHPKSIHRTRLLLARG